MTTPTAAAALAERLEHFDAHLAIDLDAWDVLLTRLAALPDAAQDDADLCRAAWADFLQAIDPARHRDRPRPAAATLAAPGSEAKIAALAARQKRREGLWHPADRTAEVQHFRSRNGRVMAGVERLLAAILKAA